MAQIYRMKVGRSAGGIVLRLVESRAARATGDDRMPNDGLGMGPPARAALELVKVGAAIAGFWLQHGTEQLTRSSQMLRRTAAAGSWQERLELQNAFLRDGIARLNEGM